MKKSILFPVLFFCFFANAQDVHLIKILGMDQKLEKVCNGCESKMSFPVSIPQHTAFIYLAISINKTGHFENIWLLGQLQQLIKENPINILGDLKPLISKIQGCETDGIINLYVATEGTDEGSNMFDRERGYVCDYSKCRVEFPGGPVGFQVLQKDEKTTFYFGFDNPSTKEAIYFHVEAVAVTRDY